MNREVRGELIGIELFIISMKNDFQMEKSCLEILVRKWRGKLENYAKQGFISEELAKEHTGGLKELIDYYPSNIPEEEEDNRQERIAPRTFLEQLYQNLNFTLETFEENEEIFEEGGVFDDITLLQAQDIEGVDEDTLNRFKDLGERIIKYYDPNKTIYD